MEQFTMRESVNNLKRWNKGKRCTSWIKTVAIIFLLIAVGVLCYINFKIRDGKVGTISSKSEKLISSVSQQSGKQSTNANALLSLINGIGKGLTIGKVQRNDAQFCNGNELKTTFPDFDYATFGYNILFGYPLANGHDPGLTHPIFVADYSDSLHTADCRYHVPKGYHLVPDVACITSFASETTRNSRQFSKSLSVNAEVSGGVWGVSFSASSGYKKTSSAMAESESVFVSSTAKCNYYFAMMDEKNPPPLSAEFLKTVKNMTTVNDVFDFFSYYGTHYLTYTLFGARFVYQHKMSKETFQSESSETMSVSVKASYSGAFSLGGGFGMEQSHSQAAKNFLEKVETETISIGAPPPANGNAMVWASTVKDTPIPVQYKMNSIEELFTSRFFKSSGIDYHKKKELILNGKKAYCSHLREKGIVNSCTSEKELYILNRIWPTFKENTHHHISSKITMDKCLTQCLDDVECIAVHHYPGPHVNLKDFICVLYRNSDWNRSGARTSVRKGAVNSVFFILPNALNFYNATIRLENVKVRDTIKPRKRITLKEDDCRKVCENDAVYSVYTARKDNNSQYINCFTYNRNDLTCSGIPENARKENLKRRSKKSAECNLMDVNVNFVTVFLS